MSITFNNTVFSEREIAEKVLYNLKQKNNIKNVNDIELAMLKIKAEIKKRMYKINMFLDHKSFSKIEKYKYSSNSIHIFSICEEIKYVIDYLIEQYYANKKLYKLLHLIIPANNVTVDYYMFDSFVFYINDLSYALNSFYSEEILSALLNTSLYLLNIYMGEYLYNNNISNLIYLLNSDINYYYNYIGDNSEIYSTKVNYLMLNILKAIKKIK